MRACTTAERALVGHEELEAFDEIPRRIALAAVMKPQQRKRQRAID